MSTDEKDSLELLKQKEIFDELVYETKFEIDRLTEELDFDHSIYYYKCKTAPHYVIHFKGPSKMHNVIKMVAQV